MMQSPHYQENKQKWSENKVNLTSTTKQKNRRYSKCR